MSIWNHLWPFRQPEFRFRNPAPRPVPIALTQTVNLMAAHARLIHQQRMENAHPNQSGTRRV